MKEKQSRHPASVIPWISACVIAALFYLYYLAFHFRITESTSISLLIALLLFLLLASALYYLGYRWVFPAWRQKPLHSWVLRAVTSLQVGMSISIWFVQNQALPAWLLTTANRFLPLFHPNSPVKDLRRYFPLVTFFALTSLFSLICFLALLLAGKIRPSSARHSRTFLRASYTLMLLSITTCVYCTDFLEIGPGQESTIWWGGTEDYVNYRIENDSLSFREDLQQYGGFLYGIGYPKELTVYLSRTGFYTTLLKLGQSVTKLPPDDVLKGTRVLMALLTAGMLTAVSLRLKQTFGLLSSLLFSTLALITYWLLGPASHLIWFFPTFLIPFSISFFLYPSVISGKRTFKRFLLVSALGYLLVFLRSYGFLPVMILSGAIPVFYYEINQRNHWKIILWRCVQVCLVGVLGFSLVLVLHFFQLWRYLGTAKETADFLINRAVFRGAGGDTNLQTPLQIFQQWMTVRVFYLSKHVFAAFPQWQAPFDRINTFRHLHRFAFAAIFYAFALLTACKLSFAKNWLTQAQQNRLFALALTTPAAMLSSWSWFPALGHMAHHYHMNGIMYIIPFGLTAFILFGVLVEYSIQLLFKPRS